ncbi:MAG TPA: DUF4214 domain-containing protein, partial [Pyrinomonadaceae bacterium]|nr:DUF4214 domain-containing protein [Pyrinomonadaceae bacterium]
MNKLDHPEINTSGLAAEVRKAMARQAIKSQPLAGHRPTIEEEPSLFGKTVDDGKEDFTRNRPLATDPNFASLDLLPSNLPKSPRLSSELIFESNEDNEYQLIDLLKFQDADFLVVAYRAVLKREPDSFGYNHYLEQLREGHLDRLDLLASLRFSPEGELKKVHIKGLALPTFMRRIGHLPIIGYPVRLGLGILRLPSLIHRVRRQEAYSGAQSRKLAEQANAAADYVDTLSAYLLNLSAATTSFFRRAELHDERHRQIQQRLENLIEQQQVDTVVG